ncbi:LA_0442/LA_0875 N-terminal domain-containing protein [Leptospira selangorensis]|uniref:LA_0442/LA_0875 N-terminal domain-containing protein n=1 Tax=Leptospira selangorensis TaxID=2484982 RepID=UPI003CC6D7F7
MFYLKRIFVLSLVVLIPINIFPETQYVYMKDGRILKGEVLHQSAFKIRFKSAEGKEEEILKSSIRRITFKNPDIKEPIKQEKIEKADPVIEAKPKEEESQKKPEEEILKKANASFIPSYRHSFEILGGIGRSSYESQVPNFHRNVEQYGSILGGNGGFFYNSPDRKNSDAKTINLRYTWKRFVGELGGSHLNSLESVNNFGSIVYPDLSGTTISQGAFTPGVPYHTISYKQINAQISYAVFSKSGLEVRPILGYHKIWQKGKDDSTYEISPKDPTNTNAIDWTIKYGVSFSDYLSGPSVGAALEYKWREKWETRWEFQKQFLHGNSIYTRDQIAYLLGSFFEERAALNNQWKVNSQTISGKLIYHWRDSVFFWTGFQYSKLTYKMEHFGGDLDLNGSPLNAYINTVLIQSLTQGLAGNSTAKAIFVGAGYSLDFSKKEVQ